MRAADIKSIKYKDNLASQRRRRFVAKTTAAAIVAAAVVVAGGYALFFSPWLAIRDITVSGLDADHAAAVQSYMDGQVSRKFLGIPVGRNILFLRSGSLAASLTADFSFLHDITVSKRYPHTVTITGNERQAEGVWCFTAAGCHYFDHDGVLWGDAVQSSGFLLLNVNDMRTGQPQTADPVFLAGIRTVVAGLKAASIGIQSVTIPAGSFTEFDITTDAPYPLKFSTDSNLAAQLDVFKTFKQKQIDTGLVSPQYLDLRYDGRVYYK